MVTTGKLFGCGTVTGLITTSPKSQVPQTSAEAYASLTRIAIILRGPMAFVTWREPNYQQQQEESMEFADGSWVVLIGLAKCAGVFVILQRKNTCRYCPVFADHFSIYGERFKNKKNQNFSLENGGHHLNVVEFLEPRLAGWMTRRRIGTRDGRCYVSNLSGSLSAIASTVWRKGEKCSRLSKLW